MSRSAALVLVALLLVAGVAPAIAVGGGPTVPSAASTDARSADAVTYDTRTGSPMDGHPAATVPSTPENNTTRRLPLTGEVRESYTSVKLDFGGAMALSAQRVQSEYQVPLVTTQLEAVQTRDARTAIVNDYLDAVDEEMDQLYAAEEAAVARYHAGEISAETLLVRLAVIDLRARAIESALDRIRARATPIQRSTEFRFESVRLELGGFETDVRRHVATAATGERKGAVNPLHVRASETGVVVGMLDGETYHRNAIRFDHRRPGDVDIFDGDADAYRQRVQQQYNWSFDRAVGRIEFGFYIDRDLYSVTYPHPQGSLSVYTDGATRKTFREHQAFVIERLPKHDPLAVTVNNVSVSVRQTLEGGPALVNVSRPAVGNASAQPLDAVVRVDGYTVGRTNEDGELWMLVPSDGYEVTVVHDGTTVNVSVPQ
jgi:hypothetical protein